MSNLTIRDFQLDDYKQLVTMMEQLYQETDGEVVDLVKINRTIEESKINPTVDIKILEENHYVIGYIIVILFWSNEFGGNIINLDELYILPNKRNNGLGSKLINIIPTLYPHAVGLQLEVAPTNLVAKRFYNKNGLMPYHNEVLFKKY